jgi:hypothetical protein
MFDEDDDAMPTPCTICGEVFDLNDGKPCRMCRKVFCPDCARWTDEHGWRCVRCEPVAPPPRRAGKRKR